MKKLLTVLFGILITHMATAVDLYPVANVEYVRRVAEQFNCALVNNAPDDTAINMEYLLNAVDTCNATHGYSTNYGSGEFATEHMANTNAVLRAFSDLQPSFSMVWDTTLGGGQMSPAFTAQLQGNFSIDWGDGMYTHVNSTSTTRTQYSHTYATAGEYTITITNTGITNARGSWEPTIGFYDTAHNKGFKRIGRNDGTHANLMVLFPDHWKTGITADGKSVNREHMFLMTFAQCHNIKNIPENLLTGLSGNTATGMFQSMFQFARGINTTYPENLFADIRGVPRTRLFAWTFDGCQNIKGSIPENMFAGIQGAPAPEMFAATFAGNRLVGGSIPENLFAGIQGAPAASMFSNTFYDAGVSGDIPAGLFSGICGKPAQNMFLGTFRQTGALKKIPSDLFGCISGAPAVGMFTETFQTSGVSGEIPSELFAGISGAPAQDMFNGTFRNTWAITTIPADLFAGISGAPAVGMFNATFMAATGLTTIPDGLFSGITGDAADAMFNKTFDSCPKVSGSIANVFDGMEITSDVYATNAFQRTFATNSQTKITGTTPKINFNGEQKELWEIFPDATSQATFNTLTGLDNYADIPDNWK